MCARPALLTHLCAASEQALCSQSTALDTYIRAYLPALGVCCLPERRLWLARPQGGSLTQTRASNYPLRVSDDCNIIEAPWLVNGGHGASLSHHIAACP
jgi:hypothetical protein